MSALRHGYRGALNPFVYTNAHMVPALIRMHGNALPQVQNDILPVLPDNFCRHKSFESLRRLPQSHLGVWQKPPSQFHVHRFRFISCK